jgi:DNA polymerase-4
MSGQVFLHVDMDAFYASVEQRDHPHMRGKPVIVGAAPGHRGVVSACSYEARKYGVHSAMPVSQAVRLCPDGLFVPVRMARYQEVSRRIMDHLRPFSPRVEQMSVDEAFLDLTGTERLFGSPRAVAEEIKATVRREEGLTISVGIAPSRYLAKLSSEVDKPDGLHEIRRGEEMTFVASLPLRSLWGVGKQMLSRLQSAGITTVTELREYTQGELSHLFGQGAANYLYNVCRGVDPGLYGEGKTHSISGERTFGTDVRQEEAIVSTLLDVASNCMFRLRNEAARSQTATAKLRLSDFTTYTLRRTVDHDITTADELFALSHSLIMAKWDRSSSIRLVGCGLGDVRAGSGASQGELFDERQSKMKRVEDAVYELSKVGIDVTKARLLKRHETEPDK